MAIPKNVKNPGLYKKAKSKAKAKMKEKGKIMTKILKVPNLEGQQHLSL